MAIYFFFLIFLSFVIYLPVFCFLLVRDYLLSARDEAYLAHIWPAIKAAMDYLEQFDKDKDGRTHKILPFPNNTNLTTLPIVRYD